MSFFYYLQNGILNITYIFSFLYSVQSYYASIVWLYEVTMILSNHCPYFVYFVDV